MLRKVSYLAAYLVVSFLLLSTMPAKGEEAVSGNAACWWDLRLTDLALAREAFAQADRLAQEEAGRLWGIRLGGPLLFVNRADRAVVANQPDLEGRLEERDGLWVGILPDDVGIANTAVEWAGRRWTMLM